MTSIHHNAENRPVRWTNAATETVITMTFDSQGRRTEYKSVTNGVQNTWLRFLYDGYLCIQVLYSNAPYNVFKEFVWDPTEPVATRPLIFRYAPSSLNLFYAFDGNKNVSDVFYRLNSNGIGAHYDYVPFGAVTRTHGDSSASFDIVSLNPFRFSSEYYDSELDLVYYNYRHYSPSLGRFLSRDPIAEQGGLNLYAFVGNKPILKWDLFGSAIPQLGAGPDVEPVKPTASLDSLIPASWNTALGDLITWLNGNHPQISYYGPDSAETQDLIKSEIARKLRTEFLKKNQGRKCSNWEDYTGAGMDFGIVRFILDIPNGRAHFVGSGDGDVYISVDEEKSLITAYFSIRNVTSMQSLMYHLWFIENIEEAGLPRSNWTQIYSWEETYACKKC